jgi:hypothetical protein
MGLNEFTIEPIALNDSCNAIACRQDLEPNPTTRYPFGAIDGKVIFYVFLVMPYWLRLCVLRTRIESRFCNPHVVIFA